MKPIFTTLLSIKKKMSEFCSFDKNHSNVKQMHKEMIEEGKKQIPLLLREV